MAQLGDTVVTGSLAVSNCIYGSVTRATSATSATKANYATSAGSASSATSATHAAGLLINGVTWDSVWTWSGQSGQPSWLWGSNDGVNMYVWNPSNFSVAYATSADSASSADTLSSTLPINKGGTGATTAADARTNLGLGNVDNTADADKYVEYANVAGYANDATTATNATFANTATTANKIRTSAPSSPANGDIWIA